VSISNTASARVIYSTCISLSLSSQ